MAEDIYDYEEEFVPRKKDSLFLWTILILLLVGLAFACWLGSFYIFGHPEEARSYAILKKLKKIESPRRFDVTAAPQGDFLTAQRAYEKYSTLTKLELERENAELLRIYIKNFVETKKLVSYVRGEFDVMQVTELTGNDLVQSGTVALMQASDYSQVVIEHIFPMSGPNIEACKRLLAPGVRLPIRRTLDVTAIIHVERLADGRMLLTCVPLHYPPYAITVGAGTFYTEPPADLNVAAGLPVTRGEALDGALKRFAQMRASEPAIDDPSKTTAQTPGVVTLDSPLGRTVPDSGAIPEPPVAKAEPVSPIMGTPRPRPPIDLTMNTRPALPAATPLPVLRATPAPQPLASAPLPPAPPAPALATPPFVAMPPPPVAMNNPPPVAPGPAPAIAPSGVPLKPFVQSNPGVAPMTDSSGAWRVYQPGTQPRGRSISSAEASSLVDQGVGGEKLYLSGNFRVSARGDNKAVLRPAGEAMPAGSEVRIVVEYPSGAVPPEEGETFARDETRAFEVRNITRADDGKTVNVFVREITR